MWLDLASWPLATHWALLKLEEEPATSYPHSKINLKSQNSKYRTIISKSCLSIPSTKREKTSNLNNMQPAISLIKLKKLGSGY